MTRASSAVEADRTICLCAIGDATLREMLKQRSEATAHNCPRCGDQGVSVTLGTVADVVDLVYREWYRPGELEFEGLSDEGRALVGPAGDDPATILESLTRTDDDTCAHIASILSDREQRDVVREGADPMYDADGRYAIYLDHGPARQVWLDFEDEILHRRRFVSSSREKMLEAMFLPVKHAKDNGIEVAFHLGPQSDYKVYRGRIAHSPDDADLYAGDPARHLMSPPARLAGGGRMNAPGLPVLYCAFSRSTCIDELRPPVGGFVVTTELEVLDHMKLLDLSVFSRPCPITSKFREGMMNMATAWSFLQELDELIQQPVLPGDQPVRYVPTQVISEYIKEALGCDGLIYSSSQTASTVEGERVPVEAKNVVFFDTAPVRPEVSPSGDRHAMHVASNDLCKLRPRPDTVKCVRVDGVKYTHSRHFLSAELKAMDF